MPTVTANADFAMLPHDRPFNGPSVLANDSTSSGTLTANLSHGPTNGSVLLNADGTYTYTPNAGFTGQDTFSYTASNGSESASATVMLTVNNAAPTANADVYTTNHDQTLTTTTGQSPQGLLGNDTDGDGDALTVTAVNGSVATVGTPVSLGAAGTVTVQADGTFSFTPAAGYIGQASFNYTVSDGVASSLATATINVVNQAPVANGDSLTLVHDYPKLNVNLTANDTDANGDALRPVIVQGPQNGTVTVNDDGTVNYVPNASYVGQDYFTYQATDGLSNSSIAMVTIGVTNQAPIAASDGIYYVRQNTPLLLNQLLVNDNDPDGEPLHPVIVQGPTNGELTDFGDGTYEYMPNTGFLGTDTFTYKLNDGAADSSVITVTLIVTDQPLVANQDRFAMTQGDKLYIRPGDLTGNDQSSLSQSLQVVSVSPPTNGTLSQDAAGNWTYMPNAGFVGTETLTYTVSDGTNTAQTTATVLVQQAQQQATPRPLASPSFSGNGTFMVAAYGRDRLKIWDVNRMQSDQIITIPNCLGIQAVAYSPRSTQILALAITYQDPDSGARNYRYGFWNINTESWVGFYGQDEPIRSIAYSSDGSRVAFLMGTVGYVYNTDAQGVYDESTQRTLPGGGGFKFFKAEFIGTTDLVVTQYESFFREWSVLRNVIPAAGQTFGAAYLPVQVPGNVQDRAIVATAVSGLDLVIATASRVYVYRYVPNQGYNLRVTLPAINQPITSVAFNGSLVAVGCVNGSIVCRSVDLDAGASAAIPLVGTNGGNPLRHTRRVTGMIFRGSTLATSSEDGTGIVWDLVIPNALQSRPDRLI